MIGSDYNIDPCNKYGDAAWGEDDADMASFIDALNRGVAVRGDGVPGESGAPADLSLDALAVNELRAKLAQYQ